MNYYPQPNHSCNLFKTSSNEQNRQLESVQKYRELVKKIIFDSYGSDCHKIQPISFIARETLKTWEKKLGILPEQARKIQDEELKLYKEHESKIQQYKVEMAKAIRQTSGIMNQKMYTQFRNLQEALELSDEAVAVAHTVLGNDLRKQGKLQAATIQFQEAIRFQSKLGATYTGLATVLCEQGKKQEAIKYLEIAKSLFLEQEMNDEAEEVEKIIKVLQKNNNIFSMISTSLKNFFETQYIEDTKYITTETRDFMQEDDKEIEMLIQEKNIRIEEKDNYISRLEKRSTLRIENFQGDVVSEKSATSTYTFNNTKFGGGFAGDGGTQTGGTLNDYSSYTNYCQAAKEIQQLLTQLSAYNENKTMTSAEKMEIVTKAIYEIENNLTLKELIVAALQSESYETFQTTINHPLAKKLLSSIEEWAYTE